jgi:hypothetical protein
VEKSPRSYHCHRLRCRATEGLTPYDVAAQAQLLLGIPQVHLDPPLDRTAGEATTTGLCGALMSIFKDGFKSDKLFSKQHLWEFVERVR